jgi:uncharacterized protein (TIGR03382 family)
MNANQNGWRVRVAAAGGVLLVGLAHDAFAPRETEAHFTLTAPGNWREQNGLGDPQKMGPCGNEGGAAETGTVTAFSEGDTVTIRLRETIFHPGHFRVALAVDDRGELPPPPPVTRGSTDCGSVPIMDPPVFPVLADGVLPHTSGLSGEQTIEVTLPDGVTCDHCTLQVIQWMAEHGDPCFYYHCADISITSVEVDGGAGSDAGVPDEDASAGRDGGSSSRDGGSRTDSGTTTDPDDGCSATGTGTGTLAAFSLAALALVARRRRR